MTETDYKIPKTYGAVADRIYALQEKRRKLQRDAKVIDEEEKFLKAWFIENIPKSDGGAIGKKCRITILNDVSYSIEDTEAFYAYVKSTESFDLLQRTIVKTAVEARLDNDQEVPGIKSFQFKKLQINKL